MPVEEDWDWRASARGRAAAAPAMKLRRDGVMGVSFSGPLYAGFTKH